MALYLIELEKNNKEFQRKLDVANTATSSLGLDLKLRRDINEFLISTDTTKRL